MPTSFNCKRVMPERDWLEQSFKLALFAPGDQTLVSFAHDADGGAPAGGLIQRWPLIPREERTMVQISVL